MRWKRLTLSFLTTKESELKKRTWSYGHLGGILLDPAQQSLLCIVYKFALLYFKCCLTFPDSFRRCSTCSNSLPAPSSHTCLLLEGCLLPPFSWAGVHLLETPFWSTNILSKYNQRTKETEKPPRVPSASDHPPCQPARGLFCSHSLASLHCSTSPCAGGASSSLGALWATEKCMPAFALHFKSWPVLSSSVDFLYSLLLDS